MVGHRRALGGHELGRGREGGRAPSDVTARNVVAGEARTPPDSVTVASLRPGVMSGIGRGGKEGRMGILPRGEHAGGWAGGGERGVPSSTGLEGPG